MKIYNNYCKIYVLLANWNESSALSALFLESALLLKYKNAAEQGYKCCKQNVSE